MHPAASPVTSQCRNVQRHLVWLTINSGNDKEISTTAIIANWISRSLLTFILISERTSTIGQSIDRSVLSSTLLWEDRPPEFTVVKRERDYRRVNLRINPPTVDIPISCVSPR